MWKSLGRTLTLTITNCTKVAGLYIGIKAATGPRPSEEYVTMAFSAFMMAGAQVSESTVMGFLERFFTGKGE